MLAHDNQSCHDAHMITFAGGEQSLVIKSAMKLYPQSCQLDAGSQLQGNREVFRQITWMGP